MKRQPENYQRGATSTLLEPFTVPYGIAARIKNYAYDRRWLAPQKLSWPVISVGNLSVGGSGKTPLVLLLSDLLSQRGWNIDVLSRGYGRSSKTVARVDDAGTPEEFGDEPLLMARHGLSVYVGARRYDAGQLAEKEAAPDSASSRVLHLLDDGFQHRKLAREIDIVLLQRADLEGRLLPAGRPARTTQWIAPRRYLCPSRRGRRLVTTRSAAHGATVRSRSHLDFGAPNYPSLRRSFDLERAGILRHWRCRWIFQWSKARRRDLAEYDCLSRSPRLHRRRYIPAENGRESIGSHLLCDDRKRQHAAFRRASWGVRESWPSCDCRATASPARREALHRWAGITPAGTSSTPPAQRAMMNRCPLNLNLCGSSSCV